MDYKLICNRNTQRCFQSIPDLEFSDRAHSEWLTTSIASSVKQRTNELLQMCIKEKETAILAPDKPWQAIFFDMDSTVVGQESIVELARFAGTAERVHEVTERAMAGELDFDAALRERVATLAGQPQKILVDVLSRFSINSGMPELAKQAREKGIRLFLVSGGFMPLAAAIASQLGFDEWRANELEVEDGILTGRIQGPIINAMAKYEFVQEMCQKHQIDSASVIAVGDGANDLNMLEYAGLALGYQPKDVLIKYLDGALFGSFDALTYLLQS